MSHLHAKMEVFVLVHRSLFFANVFQTGLDSHVKKVGN